MSDKMITVTADAGRRFGLNWTVKGERLLLGKGEWSEVTFESLETSVCGGAYFIDHDSESGEWFAYEAGGVGLDVWDYGIGEDASASPLEAMRAVARHDREQRRLISIQEAAMAEAYKGER